MSTAAVALRAPSSGSDRKTAVLVGVLFLTATATFLVGSGLIVSYFSGASPRSSTLLAGVLLEVVCAVAGAGIGLAMLPLLGRHDVRLARAYAGLRITEGVTIVLVGAYMLSTKRELAHYDAFIYVFTTTAGLILSYLLYVSGLVPRLLSKLGLLGYVVLAIGIPITLMGFAELDAGWGLIFVAPGGLFELLLPVLLIIRGFSVDRSE